MWKVSVFGVVITPNTDTFHAVFPVFIFYIKIIWPGKISTLEYSRHYSLLREKNVVHTMGIYVSFYSKNISCEYCQLFFSSISSKNSITINNSNHLTTLYRMTLIIICDGAFLLKKLPVWAVNYFRKKAPS